MNWDELKNSNPTAAREISKHLSECECGEDENVEQFQFEEKSGVVRAVGPNDKDEGVPPLWYIPRALLGNDRFDGASNGICTGDPTDRETAIIKTVGFQYDWRDYGGISLNSLLEDFRLN